MSTVTTARMRKAGITADRWPYGPNISAESRVALLDWAETTGYRLATPRGRCLHWVVGQARACSAMRNTDHRGLINGGDLHHVLDHVTFWTRSGKPALILAQPYYKPTAEWVAGITADWPVDIEVAAAGPWYGYGTHGIFITPRSS